MKYLLAGLLLATQLQAAPLTIVPNGSESLVTAGIPFAACALPDVASFRLLNERGEEVPIFIKPTLFWPESRCAGVVTVRAVKIQFAYEPGQGEATYDWELAPRTTADLREAPVVEVASENAARAGYMEPAFFAINDPAYLVSTGLISPTTVAGDNDYDRKWYPESFKKRVDTIDFKTTKGENWLFDSVSSIYQQALRTGELEQYREAYLEHEFYMGNMEVVDPKNTGRWKLSPGDIKYVYLTPMKLHLALTGDDSWTPQENGDPTAAARDRETFIRTVATKALAAQAIGRPYTRIGVRFTERETGFAFQQLLAAYELTGDPALLAALSSAVNNLYVMMTDNPDGLGNHGYLSHSWDSHEGSYYAYLGMTPIFDGPADSTQTMSEVILRKPIGEDYKKVKAGVMVSFKPYGPKLAKVATPPVRNTDGTVTIQLTEPAAIRSNQWAMFIGESDAGTESLNFTADRSFSPWMQAVVADGLWQFYNLTGDADVQEQIAEMLLGFGRAITAYAIDGRGLEPAIKEQIESAFNVTLFTASGSASRGITPHTRYVANYLMGTPEAGADYINYMNYDGGSNSDQHSPESLFQVALALRFETNPERKAAMQSLAEALSNWFAADNLGKTIVSNHPVRYFNWTNKQDPWGTFEATLQAIE